MNVLLYALPELREHAPHTTADLHLAGRTRVFTDSTSQRPSCRRCTAARGISGEVVRWVRHDQNVCLKHHLWIGPHVIAPREQTHLADQPDILNAQTRHNNLIRRHGQAVISAAFHDATMIIAGYAGPGSHLGCRRLASLTGDNIAPGPDHPWLPLLTYPEAIALTELLAHRAWRHMAQSHTQATPSNDLRAAVHDRLGTHQPLTLERDPLDTWWRIQRRSRCALSHPDLDAYAETVSLERWPKRRSASTNPGATPAESARIT